MRVCVCVLVCVCVCVCVCLCVCTHTHTHTHTGAWTLGQVGEYMTRGAEGASVELVLLDATGRRKNVALVRQRV